MKRPILKIADIIIALIILVLSAVGYVAVFALSTGKPQAVLVELDGKEYGSYQIVSRQNAKQVFIRSKYGYNTMELVDGGVRVIDADCPDKLDVKQGLIKHSGEVIVCLPHRLVIRLEGGKVNVDARTY